METTIIINGILMTILGLGFLSYIVWLGFRSTKLSGSLNEEVYEIHRKIDNLYREFDNKSDDLHRELDKLDSRFDRKMSQLADDAFQRIDSVYTQIDKNT